MEFNNEIILNIGLCIVGLSIVFGGISAVCLSIKKCKLKKKFDEEYGIVFEKKHI